MARSAAQYTAEVAVVGGGPAGLIAAIALAAAGAETALIAPAPGPDRRTTALLDGSVKALAALGVWDALAPKASALKVLRLVDATRRLIRAPEVAFDCAELGLEAFGYNIENEPLRDGLLAAARAEKRLRLVAATVTEVAPDDTGVTLRSNAGGERVRLVVAADGRDSFCRKAAGIATRGRKLAQSALALTLRHSRPHGNVSTEFHTESGPFTLVPLPGRRSSLVWVVRADKVEALTALGDAALSEKVERQAHSILGKMEVEAGRGVFPLAAAIAERFAARRIVLVGEAGHVLPPIGAQGLNLGIRDAALIAELVADARRNGIDLGDACDDYDRRRRSDVRSRAIAVDMFSRSLLTDFLPAHALRGLGLALAASVGPLRRLLMREGLGERADAPRLVRGEAL
ncbi:MAG TPA: UbiH/UbiF family hydroxylase [Xanthobacteraceae bacterium]|nr:UbiH/UbiF family hydroxylase [Xanthobacteraceae bacterium]